LKILSLDTSTPRGSVALLDGRVLTAELRVLSLETHSARLLASVDILLKSAGWNLADLGLVVAGIGPGSFTGIRIGVATAMGLAQTLSIPFAGISNLDALAHQVAGIDGRIGIVMDAQRSQVYFSEYLSDHGKIRSIGKPTLVYPSDLRPYLRRSHLYLIGDGAVRYSHELKLPSAGWPRLVEVDLFLAAALGRLALGHKRLWRSGEFLQSEPLYIRPPDAFRQGVRR
jgi:tRNA threonylcarbamoyl adenosine modification protein YeaZ